MKHEPTLRTPEPRTCRRCAVELVAERHQAEDGITWIWRCSCGWASARTESGVVSRARARKAIAQAAARIEATKSERAPSEENASKEKAPSKEKP